MTHGTQTGYRAGCRCGACTDVYRAYHRAWARDSYAGRKRTVDAAETIDHIGFLHKRGMSDRAIEAASGVGAGTVYHITRRSQNRCRRTTADRILSVTPEQRALGHLSDATSSRTMIDAMVGAGIPRRRIAMMVKRSPTWTGKVLRQTQVRHGTHRRIAVLYELLARQGIVPASVLEEVGA